MHPSGVGLSLLVTLFVLAISSESCRAHTEKENLAYIERIISLLNNQEQCDLPTFSELDEMQKAFAELEEQYGLEKFETMLSHDMRLVRQTVLDQWDSFRKRMTSTVVIRAARRRSFLCKVEDYQLAKYQDSVCTRFKDVKNEVTDRVFEKNPTVRYLKHLETGEVIERPEEEEQQQQVKHQAELKKQTAPVEALPKTVGEEAGEDQIHSPAMHKGHDDDVNAVPKINVDVQNVLGTSEEEKIVYKDPADGLQPGDHYLDDEGNPHVFLGRFTLTSKGSDGATRSMQFNLTQDLTYDPLNQIPVPKSTDEGEEEPMDDEEDKVSDQSVSPLVAQEPAPTTDEAEPTTLPDTEPTTVPTTEGPEPTTEPTSEQPAPSMEPTTEEPEPTTPVTFLTTEQPELTKEPATEKPEPTTPVTFLTTEQPAPSMEPTTEEPEPTTPVTFLTTEQPELTKEPATEKPEPTTAATIEPTTAPTLEPTSEKSEPTTEPVTVPTTEEPAPTTVPTTELTTERPEPTTVPTTEPITETTTERPEPTTSISSAATTEPTLEVTTESTADPTSEKPEPTTVSTTQQPETTTVPTTEPTTTEAMEPLFDEFGAPYIDIEDDDESLAQVVRLPRKDWQFDQVFGYFKWPDEGQGETEPMQLDENVRLMWIDFTTDPYSFDRFVDSPGLKRNQRVNGAKQKRLKAALAIKIAEEERRDRAYNLGAYNRVAPPQLPLPPVDKSRWGKMLNNNVCRLVMDKDAFGQKFSGIKKSLGSWGHRKGTTRRR